MEASKNEGVPKVKFTPTFFGDAAKAVPFKNREGNFVSWGHTTDFAPFEQFLWPLFKEIKEGTMAVQTHSGPKMYVEVDGTFVETPEGTLKENPEWEARQKDKELAIKVAKEIGLSFWTTVLATVRVQGWRAPWMLMVLFLILVSYPTSAALTAFLAPPQTDNSRGVFCIHKRNFFCPWAGFAHLGFLPTARESLVILDSRAERRSLTIG